MSISQSSGNTIGGTSPGAANVISGNGVITGNGYGVEITDSSSGNFVQGNMIGTDTTGTIAIPNQTGVGIDSASTGNIIGGEAIGAGNVISGNIGSGVYITDIGTTGNLVAGNLIGTDVTGSLPLGNGRWGVLIYVGPENNTIGGTVAMARNVISADGFSADGYSGVEIYNANDNLVEGNYVGTDAAGTAAIANAMDGIQIGTSPRITRSAERQTGPATSSPATRATASI